MPDAEPLALEPASDRRLPGSLAWALLGSQVTETVLEVNHAGDANLGEEAVGALEVNLVEHGGKATVRRVMRRELPVQEVYSQGDLRSLAAERGHSSGDGIVSVQVLVLPGRFEVEGVPGAAFEATSFAVFPDQIGGRLPSGANIAAFQTAVVVHELGHLFGLVNLTGQGSFHEDQDHPGHSRDDNSPMHPAVESGGLASVFGGGPPTEFTDDDRREMQAIRERTSSGPVWKRRRTAYAVDGRSLTSGRGHALPSGEGVEEPQHLDRQGEDERGVPVGGDIDHRRQRAELHGRGPGFEDGGGLS